MAESYDLVVIGAGSGGVRAGRLAAGYGARVAVIEEYRVGGTCVIRGCVPKKLFVYASRFTDLFDVSQSFGWQVDARFDWPTLVANKDKEIARLEAAYVANLERSGAEIIRDRAIVTGPNSVRTVKGGRELHADKILVATGGRPIKPAIPGAELGITSNEAFHLEKLPHSILIDGGGYIGVEFATIFAGLGVETTLIYRGPCILRGFDDDIRRSLEAGMQERGIRFIYETTLTRLERRGADTDVTFSDGTSAPYGLVMFATGRRPNTAGFGLEEVGVHLAPSAAISVDDEFRSSVPSIFAVGDVNGRAALTPVAIREGAAFAETHFHANPTIVDLSILPTAVFAEPEIGTVGLTEAEAATHGDIDVYLTRFRPMMNTLSLKSQRMML
jgi:glutathione reductase (NADPH)